MNRISTFVVLVAFGVLASGQTGARANDQGNKNKDKFHKASMQQDHDGKQGKNRDGKDNGKKHHHHHHGHHHHHHHHNGSSDGQTFYPGGVKPGPTAPKGTPENPTPVTHKIPRPIPIVATNLKGLGLTGKKGNPTGNFPGQPGRPGPTSPSGQIPNIGTGLAGFTGEVANVGGNIANGVGDILGGAAKAASDIGSGIVSGLESIF
jgi:hypothetical protein